VSGTAELGARQPSSTGPRDAAGDLVFFGVACAFLIAFVTVNALNVLHEHAEIGRPLRPWEPVVWEGSSAVYFAAVLPGILAFTRRVWPLDPPRAPRIGAHLILAVAVSLGHIVAIGAMRWSVYRLAGAHYDAFGPLVDWAYEMRKDVLAYAGMVSAYVGWRRLRAPPAASSSEPDVLEVRDGARRHFVPLAEVVWVEAAGNYVELHRGASGLLHRASLADMQRRLEGAGFVRIHRSRLVRRDAIEAIESKSTGDFVVRLRDGRELAGSRRYRRPLLAD
jgi:hypothetical protein